VSRRRIAAGNPGSAVKLVNRQHGSVPRVKRGGSPGSSVTSKLSSGMCKPLPCALTYASLRVQQARKAAALRSTGSRISAHNSPGARYRRETSSTATSRSMLSRGRSRCCDPNRRRKLPDHRSAREIEAQSSSGDGASQRGVSLLTVFENEVFGPFIQIMGQNSAYAPRAMVNRFRWRSK
jgi:hypothetical protein